MRLICPNCDAQYEVPDDVMPTEGRDVQCSNCGQTWFQHHPDHAPDEDEDNSVDVDAPSPDEEISPPPPPVAAPAEPERKQLDPAVADILRQEAEAEHEARRKRQSEPLESQPDLGLDSSDNDDNEDRRARQAQERMARMRGEPEPISDDTATAAAISSRRDLLPDIEEINSTLRTGTNRDSAGTDNGPHIEAPTTKKRKRGFRRGFLMMVVLFAVLAAIYSFAPQIAKAVPQADPYLSSYVAWVDKMRLILDGYVQSLLSWLDTVASRSDS
ncbi:MAG: zinc-ribbon domain-containing protein [Sulfitobacter sp.]